MRDQLCIEFLQWALPRLGLRWPGFRKVRGQVCKRIQKRIRELNLPDIGAYSAYLEQNPEEWAILDPLCRVTISEFYRDKGVFEALGGEVLPRLAQAAQQKGETVLRIWSAGCASGEEPYTLSLLWKFQLQDRYPDLKLDVVATDIDAALLERARQACYPPSSVKALLKDWLDRGFVVREHQLCLRPELTEAVHFLEQDVREKHPEGLFHVVLCRNLAFTYYDAVGQKRVLERIREVLLPSGALVLGTHESLPEKEYGFKPGAARMPIYKKVSDSP